MAKAPRARTATRQVRKLDVDEALIALFIGAMNANGNVSPEEAARAHHLIWSTRRFRRKSGDTVARLIAGVRTLLETREVAAVIAAAARTIPRRLRPSAFALVVDLLLADGKIDPPERRFLQRLGSECQLDPAAVTRVVEVMLVKNQL
jgi:tellurite resistance protein